MRYTEDDAGREPTMSEFRAMDAQDEGAEACDDGIPLDANPYPHCSRLSGAWTDGWKTQSYRGMSDDEDDQALL